MLSSISVETLGVGEFDERVATQVAELLCRIWPRPGRTVASRTEVMRAEFADFRGPASQAPQGFFLRDGEKLLAYAHISPRTIRTASGIEVVAGLARVCTDECCRGKGLGEMAVRAAWERVHCGDFEWSLYQTSQKVRPFYEKLGATVLPNPIINSLADDPQASPFWDEVVMRYPADAPHPEGVIDLMGPGW